MSVMSCTLKIEILGRNRPVRVAHKPWWPELSLVTEIEVYAKAKLVYYPLAKTQTNIVFNFFRSVWLWNKKWKYLYGLLSVVMEDYYLYAFVYRKTQLGEGMLVLSALVLELFQRVLPSSAKIRSVIQIRFVA